MKKILLVLLLLIFTCTGCKEKEHAGILFNAEPITKENILSPSRYFVEGQKIYYLFFTPEKLDSKFIRVQIFKVGDTVNRGGYKIYMTNDYRVMKQNVFYYYNNLTVYEKGRYVMQVFALNNLCKPLAYNEFVVK